MFFKSIIDNLFTKETRQVAKHGDETLAPLNIKALQDYAQRIDNQQQTAKLIARIFSDDISEAQAANSSSFTDSKKVVNS
ncbi:MAG: hypothetical protein ACK5MJ_05530 [Alphaproteobacteria bacterium]